jgi:ubiquinone/menaquinone biosynthesis C-methylase UbiE
MNANEVNAIRQQHERAEKLASIYDRDILQLWSVPFGKKLLPYLQIPAKATILDVACGTGYPSMEIARRMDGKSRIIALDFSYEMLRVAREKAGELNGKRIFFKHGRIEDLNFAPDTFDMVVCNCGVLDFADREQGLREMARGAKPGAKIYASFALRNTFREFFDIYFEVLQRFMLYDVANRLVEHIQKTPDMSEAEYLFTQAGLVDVIVERSEFQLLFPSGREFFFAPLIEYGHLQSWKDVVGRTEHLQPVFWHIKNAIDRYFARRVFPVTIEVAVVSGRKP